MKTQFVIYHQHVKDQFIFRYKRYSERAEEIINRVITVLETHTPRDWRFTESPSSRFFIIEQKVIGAFQPILIEDLLIWILRDVIPQQSVLQILRKSLLLNFLNSIF